jgi:hypothetical protein
VNDLLKALDIHVDQVWRIDPQNDGATDVEIVGTGTRGSKVVLVVRPVLPGGWSRPEDRPVELDRFVRHAVLVCEAGQRAEYDKGDYRRPFVR